MQRLLDELRALRSSMLDVEVRTLRDHPRLHRDHLRGARNLAHYVALRSGEARRLQERLASEGLSSLGRSEGNVLANVDAVLRAASRASGSRAPDLPRTSAPATVRGGRRRLDRHADALLGPARSGRAERILVTLPREAADDARLVRDLVAAGMDCARVNCAHDDADVWTRMIRNVRDAGRRARRPVHVVMDLAGPKLRTGPLAPGPEVLHWGPRRDELGCVTEPARILLAPAGEPVPQADAVVLPVDGAWLARRRPGDVVSFVDARGKLRTLRVAGASGRARWALGAQTSYVVTGTRVESSVRDGAGGFDAGSVGRLPPSQAPILLRAGDEIVLTRSQAPGTPARRDASGRVVEPARIGCTLPEAFAALRRGHAVWFDDGRIGGTVASADRDEVRVRIEHASAHGDRLRADKGINLPDTAVDVAALTDDDVGDLRFVVEHADAVAMSFVRRRADVEEIVSRLAALGRADFGLVLKIETRQAFDHLPELLLAAMRMPRAGVMIARGDLAVECGWERLAELQEEILWFCEAAHLPAIWATQVLDGMARSGRPTRAEVTDAAMSGRAECVMLNKGPHVREAVAALDSILRRMDGHRHKKRSLLRRLHVAQRFVQALTGAGGALAGAGDAVSVAGDAAVVGPAEDDPARAASARPRTAARRDPRARAAASNVSGRERSASRPSPESTPRPSAACRRSSNEVHRRPAAS